MTDADRVKFAEVFNALAAAFGVEPSDPMLEGYWMGLESMTIDDFQAAAKRAIGTLQFFPKVVDLKRMGSETHPEVAAALAWESVRKAISKHGAYVSMDFGPLINATIRNLGGWGRLCGEDSDELAKWVRKDFERIYLAFLENGVSEDSGRHLPGIHENAPDGLYEAMRALPPGQPTESLKLLPGATTRRVFRSRELESSEPMSLAEIAKSLPAPEPAK